MSATGFSRDEMWATIKSWTRDATSSVARDLHDMATQYEDRKKIGLLPPDASALAQPPASVVAAAESHTPSPTALIENSTPDIAEARTGAIVREKA